MNTAIRITLIICATIIIMFVIACIHDYLMTTANARSIRRFEKAYKDFSEKNATNNAHLSADPAATQQQTQAAPLNFPNSESNIEARPLNRKYY